jgi:serine/threonine protein kinase
MVLDLTRKLRDAPSVEDSRRIRECPQCGTCFDADTEVCTHDGRELKPPLPIERRIDGRYRLDRRLSQGGMAAVYLARDLHLGLPVVIKVLLGNFALQEAARRFETEAELTARVQHLNIITLYDHGTTTTGAAYLVLELLDGETLAHRLSTRGPLAPRDAAIHFDELCSGVAAAHLHQVVHRDLKPDNIFLARDAGGRISVKILDFGVARALDEALSDEDRTPGALIGTFRYMAPEQLRGEPADERSDIFAIGVLLVESLTGVLPFPGSAPPRLLHGIEEGYCYPGTSAAAVEFDRVLEKCLHPDPDQRYPTVEELRQDLVPALNSLSESKSIKENPHDDLDRIRRHRPRLHSRD